MPRIDTTSYTADIPKRAAPATNVQDPETFRAEAQRVAAARREIRRRTPSRHEGYEGDGVAESVVFNHAETQVLPAPAAIQGSTTRGLIIHKLLEEVLTGEIPETALIERAGVLLEQLDVMPASDPSDGPVPSEMADSAKRALACPQIVEIRESLVPEFAVASSVADEAGETILTGAADAVALNDAGHASVVVDWKSDVVVSPGRRDQYRRQIQDYGDALGARYGLIVYATEGEVERVDLV